MSKSRSANLDTHKKSTTFTTALIARVVCTDGYTVTLSNHDQDIVYDDGDGSATYSATKSAAVSNIETDATLSVDNGELSGALDFGSPVTGFSAGDIRAGRYDGAVCYLYEVNYNDLTMGHEWVGAGKYFLGEWRIDEDHGTFSFEILSKITLLKQAIAERTSLTCRNQFGDKRCKIVLGWSTGSPSVGGQVTSVGSPDTTTFTDATLAGLDDDYLAGVTITFNRSPQESAVISAFSAGQITLATALSSAITTADTWTPENLNADLILTGSVTSVGAEPLWIFSDSSRAEADNFFVPGVITWTSGANAGLSMEIKAHVSDEFELTFPVAYNIQVGDAYQIRQDCTKMFTSSASPETNSCRYWGNEKSFSGEPFMPVETAGEYANV